MAVDYIPSVEADFVTWITNFSTLISASPTSYGLDAGDASALETNTNQYLDAYTAAKSSPTRGPSSINTKDARRANVTANARQLATRIQANPAVTDAQKTNLGLTVRKANKTPVPAPTSQPMLTFIAATKLEHTLRSCDQMTPNRRAMPFGVVQLTLFIEIVAQGATPTGIPTRTQPCTKNPIAVTFTSGEVGKVAYYTAVWQTRTGLQGPISASIWANIVGG